MAAIKERLYHAIRKNWWLGIFFTGAYIYLHDYRIAVGVGLLMLVWNLVLIAILSREERASRDSDHQ